MSVVIDGTNVISLSEVHDEIYGDTKAYSDDGLMKLNEWLAVNQCTFYARPREQFFVAEAIAQAERMGLYCVLVEDLS